MSMTDSPPVSSELTFTYKVTMSPHCEDAQTVVAYPGQNPVSFHFEPVERDLRMGSVLKIGRKPEKKIPMAPIALNTYPEDMFMAEEVEPHIDFVAFQSKVVSRMHAELWVSDDGKVMFKDVGSSSGTWVNKRRMSPAGKESRAYEIENGDVIQLGITYQGEQEDIFKSVGMKIFVTVQPNNPPSPDPFRSHL
ncbi:SMAD/FHA domain-containing protein [Chytriomyces cf. hyalinus JEL632]|nr:SMAD/FHA domain-containing protein [Chytriomyces cf. hyalinus JEL632]